MRLHAAPIIVTGLGRSGTTWMQTLLSQHPRIQIHGQTSEVFDWNAVWSFYQSMVEAGGKALRANQHHAGPPHHAGSTPERTRGLFGDFLRKYLSGCGPEKIRWGWKWIFLSANPDQIAQVLSIWPHTRWVVCLRDPFATIASNRNTFNPEVDCQQLAEQWVATCRFVEQQGSGRVATFQIDRLQCASFEQRRDAVQRVLDYLDEPLTQEVEAFVRQWPTVHKVVPNAEREFVLDEHSRQTLLAEIPELGEYMKRLGYTGASAGSLPSADGPPPRITLTGTPDQGLQLPGLLELRAIESIRALSNYGNHTLGMLLYAIAYARCAAPCQRDAKGTRSWRNLVEIGYFKGYSALMLTAALVDSGAPGCVVSVELVDRRDGRESMALQVGLRDRHRLVIGDSVASVERVLAQLQGPIDLLYIDGNHLAAAADFHAYEPFLAEDATVLFHDNYFNQVRQTIDSVSDWQFVNLHGWAGLTAGTRRPY